MSRIPAPSSLLGRAHAPGDRIGRRAPLALALGGLGLGAYLLCGVPIAPTDFPEVRPETRPEPGTLPPFSAIPWDAEAETRAGQLRHVEAPWTTEERAEVADLVDPHVDLLDATLDLVAGGPVELPRLPDFRALRSLCSALSLRARLRGSAEDVVGASRVGRSVLGGAGPHPPTMITQLVGVSCLAVGLDAIPHLVGHGDLPPGSLERLRRELAAWEAVFPTAEALREAELTFMEEALAVYVETNRIPVRGTGARLYARVILPVTRAGREELGAALARGLRELHSEAFTRFPMKDDGRLRARRGDLLLAPFSRSAATRVALDYAARPHLPQYSVLRDRLSRRREQLARARLACAESALTPASR